MSELRDKMKEYIDELESVNLDFIYRALLDAHIGAKLLSYKCYWKGTKTSYHTKREAYCDTLMDSQSVFETKRKRGGG
jgi:hypothetical protein